MSCIFRIEGCQFAGPTQLLPLGVGQQQAEEALRALRDYLGGKIPNKPFSGETAGLADFRWRESRTATKNMLAGVANCIQQLMPKGWTMKNMVPSNCLLPRSPIQSREKMTEAEMIALGIPAEKAKALDMFYIFDHRTLESRYDFLPNDQCSKLVFSADEGTEACVCRNYVGCFLRRS